MNKKKKNVFMKLFYLCCKIFKFNLLDYHKIKIYIKNVEINNLYSCFFFNIYIIYVFFFDFIFCNKTDVFNFQYLINVEFQPETNKNYC